MPKVTQEHLDRRRREILEGARRCFSRFGYEGATVRRLEREIGLSRGAIFNYFPDKWELFFALAVEEFERSPDSWANGGFEELARSTVEDDPSWVSVHFEFARQLRTQPGLRQEVRRRLAPGRDRILMSLEQAQRAGEFRSDVPPETLRAFLAYLLDGIAIAVSLGAEVDIDAILKLVDETVGPRPVRPLARRDAQFAS
jgi:AcrR family transcriptional regulator